MAFILFSDIQFRKILAIWFKNKLSIWNIYQVRYFFIEIFFSWNNLKNGSPCRASFVYAVEQKLERRSKAKPKENKKSEEKKIFLTKVARRFMGCNRDEENVPAAHGGVVQPAFTGAVDGLAVWHVVHNELKSHLNEYQL